MPENGVNKTKTDAPAEQRDGNGKLSPQAIDRLYSDGYSELEILPDGTLRETVHNGQPADEQVTRTLKTERTWY